MGIELLKILCFWASLFLIAGIVSKLALAKLSKQTICPDVNSKIRLRQGASIFHSTFVEASNRGWKISAPLSKSDVVPLRPSESMMVDFVCEHGLCTFFTQILYREKNPFPTLVLKKPTSVRIVDRRLSPRLSADVTVKINNQTEGQIENASCSGARVLSDQWLAPGDMVSIESGDVWLEGWVLECEPKPLAKLGFTSRICFRSEAPLERIMRMIATPGG